MTKLFLLAAYSQMLFAACLPVTGTRIFAADLARADAQFSALPSTLVVGFAPDPGAKRILTIAELERLGRANGIALRNPSDVCFELPMMAIREEDAMAAMRRSLPADAELRILELSKPEIPAGSLEFPIENLEPPAPGAATQLWRGYVKYADTRKAAFWARVTVTIEFTAVVAAQDLPVNAPVNAASLRIETRVGPLAREKAAARIDDVIGRTLKRPLKAGSTVPLALLTVPAEVRRGDPVRVDVQCGPAHIQFDAVAESSASQGEMIELRNPSSGKTFRAMLEPGSKVAVTLPEGQTL